ncbi:hypothetical protein SK128_027648 [Halocaridina rubra]|uniref:Uncharacterized protein n=1 Tax=Halocaridina rubra TaxID=373956 RepID=A0AAN8XIT1_HALRR
MCLGFEESGVIPLQNHFKDFWQNIQQFSEDHSSRSGSCQTTRSEKEKKLAVEKPLLDNENLENGNGTEKVSENNAEIIMNLRTSEPKESEDEDSSELGSNSVSPTPKPKPLNFCLYDEELYVNWPIAEEEYENEEEDFLAIEDHCSLNSRTIITDDYWRSPEMEPMNKFIVDFISQDEVMLFLTGLMREFLHEITEAAEKCNKCQCLLPVGVVSLVLPEKDLCQCKNEYIKGDLKCTYHQFSEREQARALFYFFLAFQDEEVLRQGELIQDKDIKQIEYVTTVIICTIVIKTWHVLYINTLLTAMEESDVHKRLHQEEAFGIDHDKLSAGVYCLIQQLRPSSFLEDND